ncbi:uncharacterized protein V6R79_007933 [Siganus canaliculatus]
MLHHAVTEECPEAALQRHQDYIRNKKVTFSFIPICRSLTTQFVINRIKAVGFLGFLQSSYNSHDKKDQLGLLVKKGSRKRRTRSGFMRQVKQLCG